MASTPFLKKALPPTMREGFVRRLVRYHLEELNGFADRLRYLAAQGDSHAAQESEKIRQRCLTTLEALAWNASEVVPLTWDWWERARPSPEDHFAPALVLRRLEPDTPRLRERWELLSPGLRALVDAVLSGPRPP